MESHNHPSYIEPYQGAATGVGGILRDVFTMGARPIASLNSLRFGDPSHPKTALAARRRGARHRRLRQLHRRAHGGRRGRVRRELQRQLPGERLHRRRAGVEPHLQGHGLRRRQPGPLRRQQDRARRHSRRDDGLGGVRRGQREKRPTVQVGDPFTEKLLLEACLELFQTDALVGIQDMGAAGLTCSSIEMAGRAGSGIEIDVAQGAAAREGDDARTRSCSPRARSGCSWWPSGAARTRCSRIFHKWDLDAAVIGDVTDNGRVRILDGGEGGREPPGEPAHRRRAAVRPADAPARRAGRAAAVRPAVGAAGEAIMATMLLALLGAAHHRQQGVGLPAVRPHGAPGRGRAARARGRRGGAGRADEEGPRAGGRLQRALRASSTRTTARGSRWPSARATSRASAASRSALTDCLNFGNPERPEIMWQFAEAIARHLGRLPASSTSRSSAGTSASTTRRKGKAILPTPTVAVVGLLPDVSATCAGVFGAPATRSRCSARPGAARRLRVALTSDGEDRGPSAAAGRRTRELALQRMVRELVRGAWSRQRARHAPRAGWRWRSPSAAWRTRRSRSARQVERSRSARWRSRTRPRSARTPRGRSSPSRRTARQGRSACKAADVPFARMGTEAGIGWSSTALVDVPVSRLSDAWRRGIPSLMKKPTHL